MYRALSTLPTKVYSCLFVPRVAKGSRQLERCLHTTATLGYEKRENESVPEGVAVHDAESQAATKEGQNPFFRETQAEKDLDMMGFRLDFPTAETAGMIIDNQRFDEIPIVHLKTTKNNTFITLTDSSGKSLTSVSCVLTSVSCGALGFRNTKKSSDLAGQACGIHIAEKAKSMGVETIRVALKGLGPGRRSGLKGLQMGGIRIVSITDATGIPFNGNRPRAKRRT